MNLRPVAPDELEIDTLDRILDKGIVVEPVVAISLHGCSLPPGRVERVLIESIQIQTEGERPKELAGLENLFPYWRRDLWSK